MKLKIFILNIYLVYLIIVAIICKIVNKIVKWN